MKSLSINTQRKYTSIVNVTNIRQNSDFSYLKEFPVAKLLSSERNVKIMTPLLFLLLTLKCPCHYLARHEMTQKANEFNRPKPELKRNMIFSRQ